MTQERRPSAPQIGVSRASAEGSVHLNDIIHSPSHGEVHHTHLNSLRNASCDTSLTTPANRSWTSSADAIDIHDVLRNPLLNSLRHGAVYEMLRDVLSKTLCGIILDLRLDLVMRGCGVVLSGVCV